MIDSSAMIIGSVKDLSFDFERKEIALVITARTGAEIIVVGGDVSNVGDVILLNKKIELPAAPPIPTPSVTVPPSPAKEVAAPPKTGLCPICNFQNDPNAKFCIKCGTKL